MFIKVNKCSNPEYWYAEHIEKVFEVHKVDDEHQAYVIDNIDGNFKMMGNVFFEDCEEIGVIDNEALFTPTKIKTDEEIIIDNLKSELEMTQDVLNAILMGTL